MMFPHTTLSLSGERFLVRYRLLATNEAEAKAIARGISLEQTVEVAAELLAEDDIRAQVVGRVEALEAVDSRHFDAAISYAIETTAFELTQLLNVVFGNTAMQPGIRVLRLELAEGLLRHFQGPRFGQKGLRKRLGVAQRPLLCTALKPMGLSAPDFADLAYRIALGGIDIIKEDHGITDQPFAPFAERVGRCAEAIDRANRESGRRCLYVANITAPADQVRRRAEMAKKLGAGGLMIAPGLVGWDTMRMLAEDETLALPIFAHPAWLGTFVLSPEQGLTHHVIFGQLPRLAGADATIFVSFGGRFSFSQAACAGIVQAAVEPDPVLAPIFPIPAGGMTLERLPELYRFYGRDVIFLIAGGLYALGPDLTANARRLREAVESFA